MRRKFGGLNFIAFSPFLALAACGGKQAGPEGVEHGGLAKGQTVEEQLARGKLLYAEHCAQCHGEDGRNGDSPPLVGEQALTISPPPERGLRESRFESARDVIQFVTEEMPPGKGGSLPSGDYVAVVAHILHENGTQLEQPLTPKRSQRIQLSR